MSHASIIDGVLTKKGKQVVKFWKYKGYAVAVEHLKKVTGVRLYTPYDGVLYAPTELFYEKGIEHNFNGEEQLILPAKEWSIEDETK